MSSQRQQQGVLGALLKPGWDAAEIVIPVLHKCLFALLAVLLYTAQHNEGPLRTHLLCMAGLTLGLWASVAWFVNEYRRALAQTKAAESGIGAAGAPEGSEDGRDAKTTLPAPAAPAAALAGGPKPVRYTD